MRRALGVALALFACVAALWASMLAETDAAASMPHAADSDLAPRVYDRPADTPKYSEPTPKHIVIEGALP